MNITVLRKQNTYLHIYMESHGFPVTNHLVIISLLFVNTKALVLQQK